FRAAGHPHAGEAGFQFQHGRAVDFDAGVAPRLDASRRIAAPFAAEAKAGDIAHAPVDRQHLAMVAHGPAEGFVQPQRIEGAHFGAGIDQRLPQEARPPRAEPVVEHINVHAAPRLDGKRIDEFATDLIVRNDVALQQDGVLGRADGLEPRRKMLGRIAQDAHGIAADELRARRARKRPLGEFTRHNRTAGAQLGAQLRIDMTIHGAKVNSCAGTSPEAVRSGASPPPPSCGCHNASAYWFDGSAMKALRGTLVWFRDDPSLTDAASAMCVETDGVVAMAEGRIVACGPATEVLPTLPPGVRPAHYPDALILPGFIDAHTHYVQAEMIGSCGAQLLDWLTRYTFKAEQAFADPAHCADIAERFCDELLRHGTTTALTFCAVYPQSVEALFAESARRNMRLVAGKVLMDRHAPGDLTDTAQEGYDDSKALLERWHGRGR